MHSNTRMCFVCVFFVELVVWARGGRKAHRRWDGPGCVCDQNFLSSSKIFFFISLFITVFMGFEM